MVLCENQRDLGGGEIITFLPTGCVQLFNFYGDDPKWLNVEQVKKLKEALNEQSNIT